MLKRFNIAGLWKACLQGWPLTGIWELDWYLGTWLVNSSLQWHFPLNGKSSSLCLNRLCKESGLWWTPSFLLGVWDFVFARHGAASWWAPNKHLGYQISNGGQHACCYNLMLEELSTSTMTALREYSWKFVPLSSGLHSIHLFPLLILFVSFYYNNLSQEHNYMLSPVSPPRE